MKNKKRVLVVEDKAEIARVLRQNLCDAGYDVDTAGSKTEALEKIRCRTYHVSLVDIMLTLDDEFDRGGNRQVLQLRVRSGSDSEGALYGVQLPASTVLSSWNNKGESNESCFKSVRGIWSRYCH